MGRKVDINDLVDARGVAELLGLAQPNTVSVYQHRYADMPRPALDLGERRVKLWLRSEILAWWNQLEGTGRTRPARRASRSTDGGALDCLQVRSDAPGCW